MEWGIFLAAILATKNAERKPGMLSMSNRHFSAHFLAEREFMKTSRTLPRLSLITTLSALLLIANTTTGCSDPSTANDVSTAKAVVFLAQIPHKLSFLQTLKYEVDTKDTESDGFRTYISETGHERDVLLTHVSFTFKGPDYGWKSDTLVQATGVHEQVTTGGWTSGTLSVLLQGPRSVLMVTKNPDLQSAVPITGCNPLMEAFSFLVSDDWRGFNCPELDLKRLLSPDTWANAAQRITSFSEETVGTAKCMKIVFGPTSGNHDVVYFPEDTTDFPVKWQHYEGAYLRREVSLGDAMVTKLLPGGASLTIPHLLTRRDYYDATDTKVFCTSQQTLSLLSVNQEVDSEDLMIDPSLADSIYDRDNNKRISVPK